MLVYFMSFGLFYSHLIYLHILLQFGTFRTYVIRYSFPRAGILRQEKSGNPGVEPSSCCSCQLAASNYCASANRPTESYTLQPNDLSNPNSSFAGSRKNKRKYFLLRVG
jgi:hypothetical protein